jgi:hypothetical protein
MTEHGGKRPGSGRKKGKVSAAKRAIADMAKDYADAALKTLAHIATKGESEAARVSAANAILDRAYGKPAQSMALSNPDGSPLGPTLIKIVAATHDDSNDPTST